MVDFPVVCIFCWLLFLVDVILLVVFWLICILLVVLSFEGGPGGLLSVGGRSELSMNSLLWVRNAFGNRTNFFQWG